MLAALLAASALQASAGALAEAAPDDKAAGLASLDLLYACLLPLPAFASAADYAAQSEKMATGLPEPAPGWAGAVHVDGAGGRGCRVTYRGPRADTVWAADAKLLRSLASPGGGCALAVDTPALISGVCVQKGDAQDGRPILTRRADVRLERSEPAANGVVTAAVLNPRP